MNYSELLALSKVGVSADGICCYRVSPVEREDAEVMVVGIRAMTLVQDAWIDNLPNSKRVCLMWIPSHSEAQNDMFDLFVEGEIEKGYELWLSRDCTFTCFGNKPPLLVKNRKTGTECRLDYHDTSLRCFQGQRCGLCKHEVVALLECFWENANLSQCLQSWLEKTGKAEPWID